MAQNTNLNLNSEKFEIIDEIPYITIADSFVRTNKIWNWHWEGRLYVWNIARDIPFEIFFEWFSKRCFFVKEDIKKYLEDAEYEYKNKEQKYQKDITPFWQVYTDWISARPDGLMFFDISPQNWEKDTSRYYISSQDPVYLMMRNISLPNISYLSIMKVREINTGEIFFYFHLFLDYTYNSQNHPILIAKTEQRIQRMLDKPSVTEWEKLQVERLVKARKWQWQYRDRLLQDINACIVTGVNDERLLIASHIKPWAIATDDEKVDYLNWLILTPTYDKLFDQGFITFTVSWTMLVSPYISPMNQKKLSLINWQQFEFKIAWREKYLEFHNENIFKK